MFHNLTARRSIVHKTQRDSRASRCTSRLAAEKKVTNRAIAVRNNATLC